MVKTRPYSVHPGWRLLLADAGINPDNVLRRAGLPADLFSRERSLLDTEDSFRLWRGIEAEADAPLLSIRVGSAISVEAFDPSIFAAFCSPDLNTALQRIARFKPLIGPMTLTVDIGRRRTAMELEWLDVTVPPPAPLVMVELAFFVQVARIGTRERICPLEIRSPHLPEPAAAFTEHFGAPVKKGSRPRHVFSAEDGTRTFLTANEKMWEFFEPDLRRRLSELDQSATTADRVRAVLLEMLPGGGASMAAVAGKLGTSSRTLQRRLHEEEHTYQGVLNRTREELARHYLGKTDLPGSEISYLLGYEDPNCFFRAYQDWTGATPAQSRATLRMDH